MTRISSNKAAVRRRKTPRAAAGVRAARPGKDKRTVLDRDAWINAARDVLVAGNIAAVKVGQLAARLGVTREAFYWHFKSLEDLQDELLVAWETDNTSRFAAQLASPGDPEKDLRSIGKFLLGDEPFRATWDTAMHNWARTSKKAARVVARIDDQRTEMIKRVFMEMGYGEIESLARARIYYLFQVGYYTIKITDSRELRLKLLPVYLRLLLGRD